MRRLRPDLAVRRAEVVAERHPLAEEDVHMPQAVVAAVIADLTIPGDRVLDPFAGYGTSLRVARRMGREATGVELLPERCEIAASAAPGAVVHQGDARRVAELVAGEAPFALVLTSPPYMTATEHPEDPLAGYTGTGAEYGRYLAQLRGVFAACLGLLAPGGSLVVNVGDIDTGARLTPLVRDLAAVLGEVGEVVQDVTVRWDRLWHDLVSDHLLVVHSAAGEGGDLGEGAAR